MELNDSNKVSIKSEFKTYYSEETQVDRVLNEYDEREKDEITEVPEDIYVQWQNRGNGIYTPANQPKFSKSIPSGYYKIDVSQQLGVFFVKKTITSDGLFNLPFDEGKLIMADIAKFWKSRDNYKKYNLLHKRGIVLYGPPGSGKTCITNLLIQDLISNMNGLVFSIEDERDLLYYKDYMGSIFREIEPNRPIITIIEDIDGLLDHGKSCEKMLLNILDGINQIENVVYIATTNYPERMEERLLNRPSRFDRKYKIGYPNAKVRKAYFEQKFLEDDLNINLLQEMTKITQGLTISHLKEIFASVIIMGNDLHEVVNEMKAMSTLPTSRDDKPTSGIGYKKDVTVDDKFEEIDWEKLKSMAVTKLDRKKK